jgi:glyoxylase-like metal-dependent hydrolase (beta-lactamase superfamily II)
MLGVTLLFSAQAASAQLAPGSLDVKWSEGAEHCEAGPPQAPIQVHEYNARTFILRENLCSTFEAPFIYLLLGSAKALLIDTGDVENPKEMPLADTVSGLLPMVGSSKMPLLVVHTHRHMDHRAADPQFTGLPGVEVVPAFLEDVQKHFGFTSWPEGLAQVELGDRTIDVIPTPGHNPTHVAFYDRNTGLFLSGDFLLPGRLLVDDSDEYLASAQRVADFVRTRPITHVLGAHIEMNREEELFPWKSTYHPRERALDLTKEDLLSLPETVRSFNGFYTRHGKWVLVSPNHQLMAVSAGAALLLIASVWLAWRYFRRRRAARAVMTSRDRSARPSATGEPP